MKNVQLNTYVAFGLMLAFAIIATVLIMHAISITNGQYLSTEALLGDS